MKKKSIEDMHSLAEHFEGKCLSAQYLGSHTKLRWECKKGHIFEARPYTVTQGHWCPMCVGYGKTITDMQAIAHKHGGECLSTDYIKGNIELLWRCKKGHEWYAKPQTVIRGHWCSQCSNVGILAKKTIEDIRLLAKIRGGECLSEVYVSGKKLQWRCGEGHTWFATRPDVAKGSWCPRCAGFGNTVEDMKKLAATKGGQYLSNTYAHKIKSVWQCKEGHEWSATPRSILHGSWCPICAQGVSETICRTVLENAFKTKFPKRKPKWLLSSTGFLMELDGYSEPLKLAFEYNGRQHYHLNKFYHNNEAAFLEKQRQSDEEKINLCRNNGVKLITIPYTVPSKDISAFIFTACKDYGIRINQEEFSWSPDQVYHSRSIRIEEMRQIAQDKSGKCLSEKYIDSNTKLLWRCKEGHEWWASPVHIKIGQWCPRCAGRGKTMEDMHQYARAHNGECLSQSYVNAMTKLLWRCKEGHEWMAKPNDIKSGHWCPKCANLESSRRLSERHRLGKHYKRS